MDRHRTIPVELEEIELEDFREGRWRPVRIPREQPPRFDVSLRDLLQFDVTMENTGSVAREHVRIGIAEAIAKGVSVCLCEQSCGKFQ